MNFIDPWIFLRVLAGITAASLFLRGAVPAWRILRRFDVSRASEGQLALEREAELASTFIRVGAVVQIGALVLTVLAADRLSRSVRGAMCAFGVFEANRWGFAALGVTAFAAFAAGVTSQLCTLDRTMRGMDLVRPLAVASLGMALLSVADFVVTGAFFSGLDLGVVASCCSAQLDVAILGARGFASGPRALASIGAPIAILVSVGVGWMVSRAPRLASVAVAAAASLAALPLALGASVLEVAPHVFEIPQHSCPFCLLRSDALGIGYPLFGAIFLAMVWSAGAVLAELLARGSEAADAVLTFARGRLRRESCAWLAALAIGAAPILRYAIVSQGRSLFP